MRFSQGRWAEDILIRTINATADFRAIPYGPSSVAPSEPREMELYFERLDKAGAVGKQPDLLILPRDDYEVVRPQLDEIGLADLPLTPEVDLGFLRSRATIAVEVENSLWGARKMPDYGKEVRLAELITKTRRFRKPESIERWERWTKGVRQFINVSPERKELKGFLESKKVSYHHYQRRRPGAIDRVGKQIRRSHLRFPRVLRSGLPHLSARGV